MKLKVEKSSCNFEREPLVRPFGFKGGYMNQIWQVAAKLETSDGISGLGLGCQNVLWSDSRVFTSTSEPGGNALMFAITERALRMIRDTDFITPIDLMDRIFDDLYSYACDITGISNLKKTFVLNALVPADNAAWVLYARKHGLENFDRMIPSEYRPSLSYRHKKVASVPISSYAMPIREVVELVSGQGYFILKLKLGSPGTQSEMLAGDMERLEQVHKSIGDVDVSYTKNGKLPYYFDANGRYEKKETLQKLLDYAQKIGAFEQILVVEEPFPEEMTEDVGNLGVLVAADESAHTAKNVQERIKMGYGAIALKAAAKTLSMTLKMAREAYEQNVPCFCADLTVNPVLIEWNKNVAARLAPLPGLDVGLLENNGHQNYKNWNRMKTFHPYPNALWANERQGVFQLDEHFYEKSAGIFEDVMHYSKMVTGDK
ncbi:MAG: L-alanine-DL-glutamate epimerase [Balneolaceae bacterium]|nr:MAG: L-alanine-DL-glutamate epimerase [Balneolaceae bacterium]